MADTQAKAPRLYVYYRVDEADLPATVAAVRRVQAALVAAYPGLQAELLRRPELTAGAVTLMETYAGPLTPALEAAINGAVSAAVSAAISGAIHGAIHRDISAATGAHSSAPSLPRHTERFQLLA